MGKYDIFMSYASEDRNVAFTVVKNLENRGCKCFIAPRDIRKGEDYAEEIVKGIGNSTAVLLIFSSKSDKSPYVLREINSAVSRLKPIIPLRIEDFHPSEAMEFYLGPTQWLDAFPEVTDVHFDEVLSILFLTKKNNPVTKEAKEVRYKKPTLLKISNISQIGMNYTDLTMKEIELDYLCIPSEQFEMNVDIEGTFDEWKDSAEQYESDTSILLVKQDEIIGYCDIYPVGKEAYEQLISGQAIIRSSMIDLFSLGGEFDAYISMIAIAPGDANQNNYLMIIDWIFEHLTEWRNEDILINRIGISVYSSMLEKFMEKFGFEYRTTNPAKGKVYETTVEDLKNNELVKKRYPEFSGSAKEN